MKTFIIIRTECYTLKSDVVFTSNSRTETEKKYKELRSTLNSESTHAYRLDIKF